MADEKKVSMTTVRNPTKGGRAFYDANGLLRTVAPGEKINDVPMVDTELAFHAKRVEKNDDADLQFGPSEAAQDEQDAPKRKLSRAAIAETPELGSAPSPERARAFQLAADKNVSDADFTRQAKEILGDKYPSGNPKRADVVAVLRQTP